jgi:hypothetical protein
VPIFLSDLGFWQQKPHSSRVAQGGREEKAERDKEEEVQQNILFCKLDFYITRFKRRRTEKKERKKKKP